MQNLFGKFSKEYGFNPNNNCKKVSKATVWCKRHNMETFIFDYKSYIYNYIYSSISIKVEQSGLTTTTFLMTKTFLRWDQTEQKAMTTLWS